MAVDAGDQASGAAVAFTAHDGNNRGLGWFGPMGTLPAHRGRGLGEALVLRCLADVRTRPEGRVIAWVGRSFYARTCGAVPERRFIVYEELLMQGVFRNAAAAHGAVRRHAAGSVSLGGDAQAPLPVCNHPLLTYGPVAVTGLWHH